MAGNYNGFAACRCEVFLGSLDQPINIPAGRVVDEGIDTVPVRISTMENVGFGDRYGYVAVRVRGTIMFQLKYGAVQGQRLFRRKYFCRDGSATNPPSRVR